MHTVFLFCLHTTLSIKNQLNSIQPYFVTRTIIFLHPGIKYFANRPGLLNKSNQSFLPRENDKHFAEFHETGVNRLRAELAID